MLVWYTSFIDTSIDGFRMYRMSAASMSFTEWSASNSRSLDVSCVAFVTVTVVPTGFSRSISSHAAHGGLSAFLCATHVLNTFNTTPA